MLLKFEVHTKNMQCIHYIEVWTESDISIAGRRIIRVGVHRLDQTRLNKERIEDEGMPDDFITCG